MAKPTGFIEFGREEVARRPVEERVGDYLEIELPLSGEALVRQAARCMDCGIPFCHAIGCPLHNRVPEFNDLVYHGRWREACERLHATNNFPEITGRVCPAPCETACTLSINDQPVLIRHIERQIVERGFAEGWVQPLPATQKSGRRVAVVGSGPAALAAAQQLARVGHEVTVFEKDDRIGGLLRYGIPDFKLAKGILDRRLGQLRAEGVQFQPGVHVGTDISARYLRRMFDAICLATGAGAPRDLDVPGRQADNVHFAMDFLTQQNRLVAGEQIAPPARPSPLRRSSRFGYEGRGPATAGEGPAERISATDKVVVVIGGGDTGSDCVGTARRQGAKEIHQLEILPEPPVERPAETPWPMWPMIRRTSSSHEEGCQRRWGVLTKKLSGSGSHVTELHGVQVAWRPRLQNSAIGAPPNGAGEQMEFKEIPGTEFTLPADLVLLAMGFLHVVTTGLVDELGLARDARGNLAVNDHMTSQPGIFAAGDAVLGASLVVRAIHSGREAADAIDRWLGPPIPTHWDWGSPGNLIQHSA